MPAPSDLSFTVSAPASPPAGEKSVHTLAERLVLRAALLTAGEPGDVFPQKIVPVFFQQPPQIICRRSLIHCLQNISQSGYSFYIKTDIRVSFSIQSYFVNILISFLQNTFPYSFSYTSICIRLLYR